MNFSVRTETFGSGDKPQQWVKVKGRPDGANVGRIIDTNEIGTTGDARVNYILFEETGEVAMYRWSDLEKVPAPA